MSRVSSTTDTPQATNQGRIHTISVFVNNKAGVLMRITQVFARRGYNIDSLVVSRGRDPRFSRMTIGISGDPDGLEQIVLQVSKLIDVIHCIEHTKSDTVVKELMLVKFLATKNERTEALQIIDHYGGKTIDLTPTSMIAMINGESAKINAALSMFSQFEIIETIRTGKIVMARGEQIT